MNTLPATQLSFFASLTLWPRLLVETLRRSSTTYSNPAIQADLHLDKYVFKELYYLNCPLNSHYLTINTIKHNNAYVHRVSGFSFPQKGAEEKIGILNNTILFHVLKSLHIPPIKPLNTIEIIPCLVLF